MESLILGAGVFACLAVIFGVIDIILNRKSE